MGIDTKGNFNKNKFEQCSGSIMNLSGCTQIFGTFDMESGSTLSICDGAAAGKVLTATGTSGIATWQESSTGTITGATNGLSTSGADVVLGGELTGATEVDIATHSLCFTASANDSCIALNPSDGRIQIGSIAGGYGYLNITSTNVGLTSQSGITNASVGLQYNTGAITFVQNANARTCHDRYGLFYTANYGGTCGSNPRWIPDVEWITGQTSSESITGATNGLSTSGADVVLGGELTGDTIIGGSSNSIAFNNLGSFNVTGSTGFQCYISSMTIRSGAFTLYNGIYGALSVSSTCRRLTDNQNNEGWVYSADYSANGASNPRWIPDYAAVKDYADSVATGTTVYGTASQIPVMSGTTVFQYSSDLTFLTDTLTVGGSAGSSIIHMDNTGSYGWTMTSGGDVSWVLSRNTSDILYVTTSGLVVKGVGDTVLDVAAADTTHDAILSFSQGTTDKVWTGFDDTYEGYQVNLGIAFSVTPDISVRTNTVAIGSVTDDVSYKLHVTGAIYGERYYIDGIASYIDVSGADMTFTDGNNVAVTLSELLSTGFYWLGNFW